MKLHWLAGGSILLLAFLIYRLLFIPATLDGSYLGVVVILLVVGLYALALSAAERRFWFVLTGAFLMTTIGASRLFGPAARMDAARAQALAQQAGVPWHAPSLVGRLLLLGVAAVLLWVAVWFLGRIRARVFWAAWLLAVLVAQVADPTVLPLWAQFRVLQVGAADYSNAVDYVPVRIGNINGDGQPDILTQDTRSAAPAALGAAEVEPRAYAWSKRLVRLSHLNPLSVANLWQPDYPNVPYVHPTDAGLLPNRFRANVDEAGFLQRMSRYGDAPLQALAWGVEDAAATAAAWQQTAGIRASLPGKALSGAIDARPSLPVLDAEGRPTGALLRSLTLSHGLLRAQLGDQSVSLPAPGATYVVAVGPFTQPGAVQALVQGPFGLRVYTLRTAAGTPGPEAPTAELLRDQFPGLETARILVGDVTGDGMLDLLANTLPAQIISLGGGRVARLWVAPNQSFRFEDVGTLGGQYQIIAAAPSWLSSDPSRFITGFAYTPQGLRQLWRVYAPALVNARLLAGVGLVVQYYNSQRLAVLAPWPVPVDLLLWSVTVLGGLWLWLRRARRKRATRLLGLALVTLMLAGCTLQTGTPAKDEALLLPGSVPLPGIGQTPTAPAPDAAAALAKAEAVGQSLKSLRFQGWLITTVQDRHTTSMYSGAILPAAGRSFLDGRILGRPLRYYQQAGRAWWQFDSRPWQAATAGAMPSVNPFAGLGAWATLAGQAERLPDEAILGEPARVYRIQVDGADPALAQALLARLPGALPDNTLMTAILQGTDVQATFWIGTRSGALRQIVVQSHIPAPGAGTMVEQYFMRFYAFDDATIGGTMPTAERIQQQMARGSS